MPLSLPEGRIAIDGEQVLGPKLSVHLGVRFGAGLSKSDGASGLGDFTNLGVGVEPGLRYYLTGTVLNGLWIGPHLELSQLWHSTESVGGPSEMTTRTHTWSAGVGALLGYSMVVSQGFTVQAGVGLGASYSSTQWTVQDMTPGQVQEFPFRSTSWGFAERATLAVGWAF
jgi:Protein of unknown function (DUF3575)